MHRLILSLAVIVGAAGAANVAQAEPLRADAVVAPHVQTVQYYGGGPGYRYREWRRREAYRDWRRHEYRRGYGYRGW